LVTVKSAAQLRSAIQKRKIGRQILSPPLPSSAAGAPQYMEKAPAVLIVELRLRLTQIFDGVWAAAGLGVGELACA
jgi:hypothetical protein